MNAPERDHARNYALKNIALALLNLALGIMCLLWAILLITSSRWFLSGLPICVSLLDLFFFATFMDNARPWIGMKLDEIFD